MRLVLLRLRFGDLKGVQLDPTPATLTGTGGVGVAWLRASGAFGHGMSVV